MANERAAASETEREFSGKPVISSGNHGRVARIGGRTQTTVPIAAALRIFYSPAG